MANLNDRPNPWNLIPEPLRRELFGEPHLGRRSPDTSEVIDALAGEVGRLRMDRAYAEGQIRFTFPDFTGDGTPMITVVPVGSKLTIQDLAIYSEANGTEYSLNVVIEWDGTQLVFRREVQRQPYKPPRYTVRATP